MEATRSMALASSTEVPPNFMTIIGGGPSAAYRKRPARHPLLRLKDGFAQDDASTLGHSDSSKVAFGLQEFRIQHCRSGCTSNCVVREHGEFPVEDAAGAKTADHRCHASAGVDIKPRLRTVIRIYIDNRPIGGAGKSEFLRFSLVAVPGVNDFFRPGLFLQTNGDRLSMAILD